MKSVAEKRRENQKTRFVFSDLFFFLENHAIYENVEKYGTAGQAIDDKYGACALHAGGYLRLHTHTLRICNTYCFSNATMVARMRLNVTLVRMLPVLLFCY